MHFLIWETLSFNLIYVAACYLMGTGMCHNMVGLLQHYTVYLCVIAQTCVRFIKTLTVFFDFSLTTAFQEYFIKERIKGGAS